MWERLRCSPWPLLCVGGEQDWYLFCEQDSITLNSVLRPGLERHEGRTIKAIRCVRKQCSRTGSNAVIFTVKTKRK